MIIVDSCGWLEWLADGSLASQYQQYLENKDKDPDTLVLVVWQAMKDAKQKEAMKAYWASYEES